MVRALGVSVLMAGLAVAATGATSAAQIPSYDKIIEWVDKCKVELLDQGLGVVPGNMLDAKGPDGLPLLVRAAQSDCDEAIEHIILAGADVNSADAKGYSVLHMAAEKSTEKVVKMLIMRTARVDAVTKDGMTVLQAAEKNLYKGKTEQRDKIIKLLKSKGAK